MVPASNLFRQHCYDSYGGCLATNTQLEFHKVKAASTTGSVMADDDPRVAGRGGGGEEEEGEEVGTSSKEQQDDKSDGWLQLGLGGQSSGGPKLDGAVPVGRTSGSLLELNLFSDRPPDTRPPLPIASIQTMSPLFPMASAAVVVGELGSSSKLPQPTPPDYNWVSPAGFGGGRMRVVSPRPRPQAGVWLVLQAAQNQEKEPFLPQIPKSYLRIKDGKMTVRLLGKYLAKKLGLEDESEVELTCRGQQLPLFSTLQDVRDHIWCLTEAAALLPDSPSTDHIMTLQYSRAREGHRTSL